MFARVSLRVDGAQPEADRHAPLVPPDDRARELHPRIAAGELPELALHGRHLRRVDPHPQVEGAERFQGEGDTGRIFLQPMWLQSTEER